MCFRYSFYFYFFLSCIFGSSFGLTHDAETRHCAYAWECGTGDRIEPTASEGDVDGSPGEAARDLVQALCSCCCRFGGSFRSVVNCGAFTYIPLCMMMRCLLHLAQHNAVLDWR